MRHHRFPNVFGINGHELATIQWEIKLYHLYSAQHLYCCCLVVFCYDAVHYVEPLVQNDDGLTLVQGSDDTLIEDN